MDDEPVATAQRRQVIDFETGDDEAVPAAVQVGEIQSKAEQEPMASVLEVIEVGGVVDDALQVALVVADREL